MECLDSQSLAFPKSKSRTHPKAVPKEPEPCSPEEPCPKSKSRARAMLADEPEPCVPDVLARTASAVPEESDPYPRVSSKCVLKCIPMDSHDCDVPWPFGLRDAEEGVDSTLNSCHTFALTLHRNSCCYFRISLVPCSLSTALPFTHTNRSNTSEGLTDPF